MSQVEIFFTIGNLNILLSIGVVTHCKRTKTLTLSPWHRVCLNTRVNLHYFKQHRFLVPLKATIKKRQLIDKVEAQEIQHVR